MASDNLPLAALSDDFPFAVLLCATPSAISLLFLYSNRLSSKFGSLMYSSSVLANDTGAYGNLE